MLRSGLVAKSLNRALFAAYLRPEGAMSHQIDRALRAERGCCRSLACLDLEPGCPVVDDGFPFGKRRIDGDARTAGTD